jgi:HAD superfamily hydrolase (TIGR01509 family)
MNNRPFKLAIFDCDGVLFDSREANRHYYNSVLSSVGLPEMNEKQLDFCHMHTAGESMDYLLKGQPESIINEAMRVIEKVDYSSFLKYMTMEPGVTETVQQIRKFMPAAISTNRSTTMPLLATMYRLDQLFDKIVCALDVKNPKPDPEGVYKILDYFKVSPHQAVYIGDTSVDQEVADRAGVPLIAYKNSSLEAMFHVEHFSEIGKIIVPI